MKRAAHITQVNGVETSAIDIADRGLAYGDGIFETIRFVGSEAPLYDFHRQRFLNGVERLALGDDKQLIEDFDREFEQITKKMLRSASCSKGAIIKIMVTRGSSGRGYVPPNVADCQFISQVFELPTYPEDYYREGVDITVCNHRLSEQPYLAGIKHLNRLDQVLASREVNGFPEGITLSQGDLVIEGTKSNVLLFEGDKIVTPRIDGCGVKGVLREYLIQSPGLVITEEAVDLIRLENADGVALINSVIGIWSVKSISSREYGKTDQYERVRSLLADRLGYHS